MTAYRVWKSNACTLIGRLSEECKEKREYDKLETDFYNINQYLDDRWKFSVRYETSMQQKKTGAELAKKILLLSNEIHLSAVARTLVAEYYGEQEDYVMETVWYAGRAAYALSVPSLYSGVTVADSFCRMGKAFAKMKQFDLAREYFQKALQGIGYQIEPRLELHIYESQINLEYKMGNLGMAKELFEKYVKAVERLKDTGDLFCAGQYYMNAACMAKQMGIPYKDYYNNALVLEIQEMQIVQIEHKEDGCTYWGKYPALRLYEILLLQESKIHFLKEEGNVYEEL